LSAFINTEVHMGGKITPRPIFALQLSNCLELKTYALVTCLLLLVALVAWLQNSYKNLVYHRPFFQYVGQ